MRTLQRYLAVALLVCVAGAVYLSVREVTLPDVSHVAPSVRETEPLQEPSSGRPFAIVIRGYTYAITPRAAYDISGLVVSQHRGDALFNLGHKVDPGNIKDVCVVWGDAVTSGAYRKVTFTSGEFTCSFSWSRNFTPAFNPEKASNNHLIPATPSIDRQIRAIHVGDQIRLTGLLVDYTVTKDGQEIFTRRTSLTRSDTGNGACEILYVTGLSVIAKGDHLQVDAGRYAWYVGLSVFTALGIVWFVRPPLAE